MISIPTEFWSMKKVSNVDNEWVGMFWKMEKHFFYEKLFQMGTSNPSKLHLIKFLGFATDPPPFIGCMASLKKLKHNWYVQSELA